MTERGVYEKLSGSGIWWVRHVDAQGRYRREKAGSKSAAIVLYRKRKMEALEGRKLPEKLRRAPVSFREVVQDALEYSRLHKRSYRDDLCRIGRLLEWFGDRPAESLSAQEVERRLGGQSWMPATMNRYRAALSFIYRLAIRNGKVRENPARQVTHRKENNLRVRFLEEAEEARLRAKIRESCPEREPEFDLALHTGMRWGEQYRLRWENVDFGLAMITVADSKNGERRHIPMNLQAQRALVKLRAQANGPAEVCPGVVGSQEEGWQRWFPAVVRAAGIEHFRWHDVRHTFASRLAMAGVDLRTIAELLGHKTLAMVMRYAHLAPAHLRDAVDRISREPTGTTIAPETPGSSVPKPTYVH